MKKWIAVLVVILGLSARNTFEGLGKDIKKGGEVIEKAAK